MSEAWRTRLFEYTWLRTLGRHYADFWQVTEESLVFAAKASRDRSVRRSARSIDADLAHSQGLAGCRAGVEALKAAGIRMAFLSNLTDDDAWMPW